MTAASMSAETTAAGRELDALVAEKVMGTTGIRAVTVIDGRGAHSEPGTAVDVTLPDGRPGRQATQLPHYSTSIAAAWLVVERLNDRFHARIQSPFEPGDLYFVGFTIHGTSGFNGRPDFRASASTAPLAICRAALLVCEVANG